MITRLKYRKTLSISVLFLTVGLVSLQLHDYLHIFEHQLLHHGQSQEEHPLSSEEDCPVCVISINSADIDTDKGYSYLSFSEQFLSVPEKAPFLAYPSIYFQLRAPPFTA